MKDLKPVIFKLNGEMYGIDITLVNGIEKEQHIVSVPNAPEYIKGIINLRGTIVPVYNLARKFNVLDISPTDSQLIIIKIGEMLLAVEVEGVEEISDIPASAISEVPKIIRGTKTSYIKEIAKVEKELLIILDVDSLLTEEEQKDVEEFVNQQNE
ncbi:MAG: chemotaxis protein CheW [Lachnospiraceae bacterium]|nr:chemotaxis protein CheW [Lachnospiraceae bacterium]